MHLSRVVIIFQICDYDGFVVRGILSVPIRNSEDKVIGVVQLMNKINGKPFTDTDINIVEVREGVAIHRDVSSSCANDLGEI